MRWGLRVAGAFLAVCIGLAVGAANAQQTVRRSTQFSYDPTTGLLTSERVDPGGAHCVETLYQYDRFGNKTRIEVRSCGSAENAFPTRVTLHRYDATPGFQAGAVVTATGAVTGVATASGVAAIVLLLVTVLGVEAPSIVTMPSLPQSNFSVVPRPQSLPTFSRNNLVAACRSIVFSRLVGCPAL